MTTNKYIVSFLWNIAPYSGRITKSCSDNILPAHFGGLLVDKKTILEYCRRVASKLVRFSLKLRNIEGP